MQPICHSGRSAGFSIIGILIFVSLTAWDTQSIRLAYSEHHDAETHQKLAVMRALSLYLKLINQFPLLLSLTGQREE